MDLTFENRVGKEYDCLEDIYIKLMEDAFRYLDVKMNYEVDVSLVDCQDIQAINREYRNIDKVTDVISFAFNDDVANRIKDPDVPVLLGEIFICIPRAIEQAKEIGNSQMRELRFLFCHGLLHLLGYDHMKEDDAKKMFALQEEIMNIERK